MRRLPQRAKVAEALEVKDRLWEKVLARKEDKVDDDKNYTGDDNRKQEREQELELELEEEVALRPKSSLWNPYPFLESDDDVDPEAWSELSVVGDGGRGGGRGPLVHLRVFVLECYYVRLRTPLDFLSAAPRLEDLQIVRLRGSVAEDEDLNELEVHYVDKEETTEYLLVKAAEIL